MPRMKVSLSPIATERTSLDCLVEEVPEEFNVRGIPIRIEHVPYAIRVLLFRDMGFDSPLITREQALELIARQKMQTSIDQENFRRKIEDLQPLVIHREPLIYVYPSRFYI